MAFSDAFNNTIRTLDSAQQWRAQEERRKEEFGRTLASQNRQFNKTHDEKVRVNDARVANFAALTSKTKELTEGLRATNEFNQETKPDRLRQVGAEADNAVATADANRATADYKTRTLDSRVQAGIAKAREEVSASNLNTLANDSNRAAMVYERIDDSLKGLAPDQLKAVVSDPENIEMIQTTLFLASQGADVSGGGVEAGDAGTVFPVFNEETGELEGYSGVRVGPKDVSKIKRTGEDGQPTEDDDFISLEEMAEVLQGAVKRVGSVADGVGQGGQRYRALGEMNQAPRAAAPGRQGGPEQITPPSDLSRMPDAAVLEQSRALQQKLAQLDQQVASDEEAPVEDPSDSFLGRAEQIQQEHMQRTRDRVSRAGVDPVRRLGAQAGNMLDAVGSVGSHIANAGRSLGGELYSGFAGEEEPEAAPAQATQSPERVQVVEQLQALRGEMERRRSAPREQRALGQPAPAGQPTSRPTNDFRSQVRRMEEIKGSSLTAEEVENLRVSGSIQISPKDLATASGKSAEAAGKKIKDILTSVEKHASTAYDENGEAVTNDAVGQDASRQVAGLIKSDPVWAELATRPGGPEYLAVLAANAGQKAITSGSAPNLMAELTLGIEGTAAKDVGQVLRYVLPQVAQGQQVNRELSLLINQRISDKLSARDVPTAPVTTDEAKAVAADVVRGLGL